MKKPILVLTVCFLLTNGLVLTQEDATEQEEKVVGEVQAEEVVPDKKEAVSGELEIKKPEEAPKEEETVEVQEEKQIDFKELEEAKEISTDKEVQVELPTEEVVAEQEVQVEGPDTEIAEVKGGARGNWQEKRDWLVKAKDENNKVQDLADDVLKLRDGFWDKFKKVQEKLDKFYQESSSKRAQIDELNKEFVEIATQTKNIEDSLIKEREAQKVADQQQQPFYVRFLDVSESLINWVKDSVLTVWDYLRGFFIEVEPRVRRADHVPKLETIFDEESYAIEVVKLKRELDTLDVLIKTVRDVDAALVKRMDSLDTQIKIAVEQSDKSRDLYNDIWDMIDHNLAKENVFKVKSIKKKIQSTQEFLKGEFLNDFETTIGTADKQMQKVKTEAEILEKKLEKLSGKEMVLETEVPATSKEPVGDSPKAEVEKIEKEPFYEKAFTEAYDFMGNIWRSIENLASRFIGWFSSAVESTTDFVESKMLKEEPEVVTKVVSVEPPKKEESIR